MNQRKILVLGDSNAGIEDLVAAMRSHSASYVWVSGEELYESMRSCGAIAPKVGISTQPSPDGDDDKRLIAGSGYPLHPETFLPEDERELKSAGFGRGPHRCDDPANDE